MRHRVWVQTWSSTKNAAMEVVEAWSSGTEVPCRIRHLMGSERVENQREGNETTIEVRFLYEEGLVSQKDRLEFRDSSPYEHYDVVDVIPDEKRRELICKCKYHT